MSPSKVIQILVASILASAVWSANSFAAPYVVGGATSAVIPESSSWSWDGSYLSGFRDALENPSNFGPAGTVNRAISTVNLSTVDSTSLSGVNMFVGTWISDANAAPITASVNNFFLNGGDLFLLQDDSDHDGLGEFLGISTTGSDGSVSNGGAPLFNGPFGVAVDVTQLYAVGQLDSAAILAKNGHIGGTNASGQVTSAFWKAGEYASGAGALFIIADIDMIATTTDCGATLCGANYSPLNDNGRYALNTFAFLQENGGSVPSIPEPETYAMMLAGLALVGFSAKRKFS